VKRLVRLIVYNWPLKLAAIALAFLLYAGLVVSQSQFDYNSPVPIKPINVPTNTVPLGTIPPVTHIRYIVNGDPGVGPGPSTWRATVDLAGVDPQSGSSGPQTVNVSSADPRFIVIDFEPRTVVVQLDPYASYTVPVQVDTGTTPEGFTLGPVQKTPETVKVSGPDSVAKYVVAAVADVTIDPHGLSVDRDVPLIPVDNQGNELRPLNLSPKSVHVTIDVISTAGKKTLIVNPNITGTPPDGYQVGAITVSPTSVTVQGDPATLSSLTRADTVPISVATSTGTIDSNFPLDLPSGVAAVGVDTVHVTVQIQAVKSSRTYEAALVLAGQQPDLDYSLSPGSVLVTLGGPVADLNRIDPAQFTITVDVAGLEPGTHQVPVVPNVQAGISVISVDPNTVTVTVASRGSPSPASATP
jgi:YbbR domain-containing protein